MKYLNRKKFVDSFFDCFHKEGNFAVAQQQTKILSEIDDLTNKGFSKYESIMKLCSHHTISFEILEEPESILNIKTYIDGREWSHLSLKNEKKLVSKKLGIEIAAMMHTKVTNIIIIENSTKK